MEPVVYQVRRSDRARRIRVTVDPARGVEVVMNRCPKIEWGRLSGEIGWHGVNSRIISARKPVAGNGFQRLSIAGRQAPATRGAGVES